jgi:hypothetical protein
MLVDVQSRPHNAPQERRRVALLFDFDSCVGNYFAFLVALGKCNPPKIKLG